MVGDNTSVNCNMMWHNWLNFTKKKKKELLKVNEHGNYDVIEHYRILVHDLYTSRGHTRILKNKSLQWAGRAARNIIGKHEMSASCV